MYKIIFTRRTLSDTSKDVIKTSVELDNRLTIQKAHTRLNKLLTEYRDKTASGYEIAYTYMSLRISKRIIYIKPNDDIGERAVYRDLFQFEVVEDV